MSGNLSVKTRVAIVNEKIQELREDFEAYIKDKNIPLEERWEVFKEANNGLSYHKSFWIDLPSNTGGDMSWGEDFSFERYQTVNLVEFLDETIPEMIADFEGDNLEDQDEWGKQFYKNREALLKKFSINDWREYVLSINVKTAEYDW